MRSSILVLMIIIIAGGNAFSQEKQHSMEITTGYPSLISALEFPSVSTEITWQNQGLLVDKEYYQPGLNLGYTYAWNKKWEVSVLLNFHMTIYDVMQYPMISPGNETNPAQYDFSAQPKLYRRSTSFSGALSFAFRYKWLVRDTFSIYSALGAGLHLGLPIPLPYIAPFGIKFGKGKVYGIVEANVTPANTFGMAGIGIRL